MQDLAPLENPEIALERQTFSQTQPHPGKPPAPVVSTEAVISTSNSGPTVRSSMRKYCDFTGRIDPERESRYWKA